MQAYVNYYDVSLQELERIGDRKPRLLMHACCGPCSCFPLTFLCPHFDVTIYYANSNIYPAEEFFRRREELRRLLFDLKRDYGYEVDLIEPPYDHEAFMEPLRPFASCKEGGERCFRCYEARMKEAYDFAETQGFDYFCTVMTISRQKDSQILNAIGKKLEASHPHCRYFYSDCKKKSGIELGKAMRVAYGLYNQDYCGCDYSLGVRNARIAAKKSLVKVHGKE